MRAIIVHPTLLMVTCLGSILASNSVWGQATSVSEEPLPLQVARLQSEVDQLKIEVAELKKNLRTLQAETTTAKPLIAADSPAAMLATFLTPDADLEILSQQLRPTRDDYDLLFTPDFAKKAFQLYDEAWSSNAILVQGKPQQTEVLISHVSSDDIRSWNGKAREVPGGYKRVAQYLKGSYKIYTFNFVEPGETSGMSYTGLIFVNGRWRLFPKLWRVSMEAE